MLRKHQSRWDMHGDSTKDQNNQRDPVPHRYLFVAVVSFLLQQGIWSESVCSVLREMGRRMMRQNQDPCAREAIAERQCYKAPNFELTQ